MGVGDYVHSKGATQLQQPMNDASNQSRHDLAEQARVDVPTTKLVAPSPLPINRQPLLDNHGSFSDLQHGSAEETASRDMFDTDVEGVDDSTIAATSVMGGDDVPYQFSLATNSQRHIAEPKPRPQYRQTPRPYDPRWYENLGDKAMKNAGFDLDDMDAESQLTSVVGDDEGSEDTNSDYSHRRRGAEEPLSKRLHNFWSASRRSYPKPTTSPHGEPSKPAAYDPSASNTRTSQVLPMSGPRKVTLPPTVTATPRTRFSPPKPSLLEKLDITPTRRTSGPRPQPARNSSTAGINTQETSENVGLFDMDYGRRGGSPHSINAFDVTNFDALDDDDDPVNDPFSRRDSVRHISPDPVPSKKRHFESDYTPEVLRQKSFSELQAESFDHTPVQATTPPNAAPETQASPEDKMTYLANISDEERRAYFSNLSMDEWEDCGDQLIEQFSSMLLKMKDMRQARRRTAAFFEAEIKRRNDTVEEQSSDLTSKLQDMRTGGAEVLRGRTP